MQRAWHSLLLLSRKHVHVRERVWSPGRADLERAWWGLGFKHHKGLLQITHGKALAANVAWSIYVLSADLTTVHQDSGSRYATYSHNQDQLKTLPPPPLSPALLPTGPSHCSWFSCLVYSSWYPTILSGQVVCHRPLCFPESHMAAEGKEQEEDAIIQPFGPSLAALSLVYFI